MKTLRSFLMAFIVLCFAYGVSAQTILEQVEDGSYYTDENYMWYDFRVSSDDPLDKEYNKYTVVSNDNSSVNGWLQGWAPDGHGMSVEWDQANGVLVGKAGNTTNDNGYSSRMIKPGTPILKYNTSVYPYVAIKFKHLPECGDGGFQDGDETKEKMYGGTRLHVVERAETSLTGANADYWLRIPKSEADALDMLERTQDNVADWLTEYIPDGNDDVMVHAFDLRGAVARNHHGFTISSRTDSNLDFYFIVTDAAEGERLEIEWIRSFKDMYDVQDYADELYATTGIKDPFELPVNIVSVNGKIILSGIDNAMLEVFNMLGQSVAATTEKEVSVPEGCYIVKASASQGNKIIKLLHK